MEPEDEKKRKGPPPAPKGPTRRRFFKYALGAGGAALVGGGGYLWWSNALGVTEGTFPLEGWTGDPVKVVAISDLHAPGYGGTDALVETLSSLKPDLLFLVGDTVDRKGGEEAIRAFGSIRAPLGKFAVLGNWDYWSDVPPASLRKHFEDAGIDLVTNEVRVTGELAIAGLDDLLSGKPDLETVATASGTGKPVLVLSHAPAIFEKIAERFETPCLTLSGHTHGGQIAPFGIAPYRPRGSGPFLKGWYRRGPHAMYVMRGVGTTIVPFRVGARPEVLALTLTGA